MDIISYALGKKGMQKSVSDYLDEHLTNPTNPPIDTSLTIAGAAADAKTAGDFISRVKEDLSDMNTATASDVGKYLRATAVENGKVTGWQFSTPSGGGGGGGQDGFSPIVAVTNITGGHRITITDADGEHSADVMDGHNGMVTVNVSGTTPTIVAQADTRYVCGEVATLDFTPSATGICDVVFTSGSTATVLTVPSTVKWANGFDPTALEANTTYEINIMDGLGVAVGWT